MLSNHPALKKLLLACLLYCSQLPSTLGQTGAYWQQQVNYDIKVTLNDVLHSLDANLEMEYINNSPYTLDYIWIQLWPNAYKNDRTAFTDQVLENGSTGFYFSDDEQRGYINRLAFKVDGVTADMEDHPQHQDIVKLLLPKPLAPKSSVKIMTPFHVKLPYVFSRSGHINQTYQVAQWFPKAAVYDRKGWHPMPYLDQGEFYADPGTYKVSITLPRNYVVAATGELQGADAKNKITEKYNNTIRPAVKAAPGKKAVPAGIVSDNETKTLVYVQENVHDFAWFADKAFVVKHDTLQLPSKRIIDVYAFHYESNNAVWANSIAMIKRAVLTKSEWLGEYPFDVVSVVDNIKGDGGGMEYPTVTLLSGGTEKLLDFVINHEVGHNWFQGILSSNERMHPWMDEGMNTYYDSRYSLQQYGSSAPDLLPVSGNFLKKRMPEDLTLTLLKTVTGIKKDQPIETSAEKFTELNYNLVAYVKTGQWMKQLEQELGQPLFDSCMREYYRRWKFKHPYPEDFKKVMEEVSGRDLSATFGLLEKKGNLVKPTPRKGIGVTSFFSLRNTDKKNSIFFTPLPGYNVYDRWMVGGLIHNYTLPLPAFKFVVAPLYATQSKQLNGIGRLGYTFYPGNNGQQFEIAVGGATFSGDSFTDSSGKTTYQRFSKIVPSLKYTFANKNPRSKRNAFLQWKTFFINEQELLFTRDLVNNIDVITFPTRFRYVNQLQFVLENNRVLYPYSGALQVEQGDGFMRTQFTGNYYFNYAKGGGMNVRLFAGKFFYLGEKTFTKQFETDRYHLNMTGPRGYEDYTYSNYFVGRNEFDKYPSYPAGLSGFKKIVRNLPVQQLMIRDGGFKVGTDLLSSKVGKTDNWLVAANFTTDIPKAINPLAVLPFKLPVKIFVDIGTYAEAWEKDAATSRFIYDAGLQLSLFKNVLNVYFPILYSKVFKDYYKSTVTEKKFVRTISFSIDLQNISVKKLIPQLPL